jgi:hypothetical protein
MRQTAILLACWAALALLFTAGCINKNGNSQPIEEPVGPPWFEDIAGKVGLDFKHDAGPVDGNFHMPQIVGAGAALFDFDGDGLLDLLLLNTGGPKGEKNRLFRQLPGGTFQDVSAGCGLDFNGFTFGVAVGDINNDGLPDVAISQLGHVRLFFNLGKGKFREVTQEAGIQNGNLWAMSMAFVDYDRDGLLDLFVVNNLAYDPNWPCSAPDGRRDYCAPKNFKGTSSKLFRNLGAKEGIRFQDVSFEAGVLKPGPGLGVIAADFTGDGWPDIFVANDGAPNHLWVNQRDGTFKEEALARGVAVNAMGQAEANMGIGWGDVDGDGLEDVFVTHLDVETNTMWRQGPVRGQFADWTTFSGMHKPKWRATGFGTVLGDFDCDGHLDAAITNGAVSRGKAIPNHPLGQHWSEYSQRNQLFANDGKGRFKDISPGTPALCGTPNVGRCVAMGDVANDGSLWLVVTQIAGPATLLKNVVPKRGSWLSLRVIDPRYKRDALGAEVVIKAGGRTQIRTVQSNGGYLTANDPRAHFGLGSATEAEWIQVRWPDGLLERYKGVPANKHYVLHRGEGEAVPPKKEGGP